MKAHLIQPDGSAEIVEYNGEPTLDQMRDFIGDNIEFVSVLFQDKPAHMIVDEMGALKPLPVNERATSIYHNAQVKPSCKKRGIVYKAEEYAQIHGPAMVLEGRLS